MSLRIAVTGAAGLVGQNLIPRLKARGLTDIVAIDKHAANTAILRRLHPDIQRDRGRSRDRRRLAGRGRGLRRGGRLPRADRRARPRSIRAEQRRGDAPPDRGGGKRNSRAYLVHISSSVVKSEAVDWYTESKEQQERIVVQSGLSHVVLRPTLMFGWFDRKHLGWLARFMQRVPVFPIPGSGRYLRQPLYVGDFCDIIMSCIDKRPNNAGYNISGQEKIDYIDLMREVKKRDRRTRGDRAHSLSAVLGAAVGLRAVRPRPAVHHQATRGAGDAGRVRGDRLAGHFRREGDAAARALEQTFQHPDYSNIVLEF